MISPRNMNDMKAIIIDDEIKSATNLQLLLGQVAPEVEVMALAHTALDGVKAIRAHQPQVVFLDIQMPANSGFDVLDHLGELHPDIVFVTAHEEYAVRALRSEAFDYLLKPVDEGELEDCVKRLLERHAKGETPRAAEAVSGLLNIPVKDGWLFIRRQELLRVEASGSYAYIYLENGTKHLVSKSIGELQKMLGDDPRFYRCHNSHIVNMNKIKRFINAEGYFVLMSDDSKAEVSRRNKEEFLQLMAKRA